MKDIVLSEAKQLQPPTPTLRDLLAIGFRHRRLMVICFVAVIVGSIVAVIFEPNHYESHMQMLVKRERVDPIVSADPNTISQNTQSLTEEELQSEVELFKSEDSIRLAVIKTGLGAPHRFRWQAASSDTARSTAAAVRRLAKDLTVSAVKKTNVIEARYSSEDPTTAARVLTILAELYLTKHIAAHSPSGASNFFAKEAIKYQDSLTTADQRLINYDRVIAISDAQQEKQITLQKLVDTEASLKGTETAIAERQRLLEALHKQLASIPSRETTQVRSSDAALLLEQLQSTLLNLELKRTELLGKFEPSYEPVQQLQSQIDETQAAIDQARNHPIREETTDKTSSYEWVKSESTKAESEVPALLARAAKLKQVVHDYRERLVNLDGAQVAQQSLQRQAKVAEDSYLLYERKTEEARISDALNQQGIVNVTVTEPAAVPVLPAGSSRMWKLLLGAFLASIVSMGSAFGSEKLDPSFRTPDELRGYIDVPLLAVFPADV